MPQYKVGVILGVLALGLIAPHLGPDEKQIPFWEPKAWLHPLLAIAITAVKSLGIDTK